MQLRRLQAEIRGGEGARGPDVSRRAVASVSHGSASKAEVVRGTAQPPPTAAGGSCPAYSIDYPARDIRPWQTCPLRVSNARVALLSVIGYAGSRRAGRTGWLRAAVLGANDGLVSTSSLMVGVAASGASGAGVVTAGIAGVVAGAMAMAAGEYVSVSSQRDIEEADRRHESRLQERDPEGERRQLVGIYQERGLPPPLAERVADVMHATDPVAAHMREQLGHTEQTRARPSQAAFASAATFVTGGLVPFLGLLAPSRSGRLMLIAAVTVLGLAAAGILGARIAGAPITRPALRVVVGGSAAMAVTALVGHLVHLSGG